MLSTPAATLEQFEVYLHIVQAVEQKRSLHLSVPTDFADGFCALLRFICEFPTDVEAYD
jgi:hypothetical protein